MKRWLQWGCLGTVVFLALTTLFGLVIGLGLLAGALIVAAHALLHPQYASLGEVRTVLEAAQRVQPGLPVILNVEPAVPMHHVIDLYDLCRLVGLDRVQFAASAS